MSAVEIIARKRDGGELTPAEIRSIIQGAADGSVPDYQVAAWLMAVAIRGMSRAETAALTLAMRDSGDRLNLTGLAAPTVDKHSTGGVGDKTTLVVVPVLAALGLAVLKMSGRGLGFSGGTVDKLESIPGMRMEVEPEEALEQVRRVGAAIVGQSPRLVPADKKLYALRDVTATADSIPLIASSIMSKKLACGAGAIVLDVKVGSGAFMKTRRGARDLARAMVALGEEAGVPTRAVLTDMEEPLGRTVGNALEVAEAVQVLASPHQAEHRFLRLCLELSAQALGAAGKCVTRSQGRAMAMQVLRNGEAARALARIIKAQGGDEEVVRNPAVLPAAPAQTFVRGQQDGYVAAVDAETIGRAAVALGAGRLRKEDPIDHAVGVELLRKCGDRVVVGDPLVKVHMRDTASAAAVLVAVESAFRFAAEPPRMRELILEQVSSSARS